MPNFQEEFLNCASLISEDTRFYVLHVMNHRTSLLAVDKTAYIFGEGVFFEPIVNVKG